MDQFDPMLATRLGRRRLLQGGAALGAGALAAPAFAADGTVDLHLPGGPSTRPMTTAFPGKGPMILQRMRPPLLETPLSVFDGDVFTPNDRFFVRWHWADIPTTVDVNAFRLAVRGEVAKPLSLTLADILRLPRFEIAAINQCSGNSRGLFQPRVPGAQWAHGAMGNALWTGVRLRDVLDLAGAPRRGGGALRRHGPAAGARSPGFLQIARPRPRARW
jgi:DMSO/TMAO reductase YedYZ molybdopterin-dependent catalytic subunit